MPRRTNEWENVPVFEGTHRTDSAKMCWTHQTEGRLPHLGHLLRYLGQVLPFLADDETVKPGGGRHRGDGEAVGLGTQESRLTGQAAAEPECALGAWGHDLPSWAHSSGSYLGVDLGQRLPQFLWLPSQDHGLRGTV